MSEELKRLTHAELVHAAAKWLAAKHSVVVTEIVTGCPETPDAFGWHGWGTTLIECKTSRADFLADARKVFRRAPEQGLGLHRYFLSEPDVIQESDLPAGWGLLHIRNQRVKTIRKSDRFTHNMRSENSILLSLLRRIGQTAPVGISIKCYQIETSRTATLGICGEEIQELELAYQ